MGWREVFQSFTGTENGKKGKEGVSPPPQVSQISLFPYPLEVPVRTGMYEIHPKRLLICQEFADHFEERAAILEYEAGYSRREAEALAGQEVQGLLSKKYNIH